MGWHVERKREAKAKYMSGDAILEVNLQFQPPQLMSSRFETNYVAEQFSNS